MCRGAFVVAAISSLIAACSGDPGESDHCVVDRDCPDAQVCIHGACVDFDPCGGISCTNPPPAVCQDDQTLLVYAARGTCEAGECSYDAEETDCPDGCQDGICRGCTPEWVDVTACDCVPTECDGCDGTLEQQDGCGNTRDVACSLAATGCDQVCCGGACCVADQVCYAGACCTPDCTGRECGEDGCGGTCGTCAAGEECVAGRCSDCSGCRAGETCIDDRCAPIAVLFARPSTDDAGLVCPHGYQVAGRWQTGPGVFDAAMEGRDFHGYKITAGWMWLCSADPSAVHVVVSDDECGASTTTCGGEARGTWHVGSGCTGEDHGVDVAGQAVEAGWMQLCVSPGVAAYVEAGHNDCGLSGPGCSGDRLGGEWHTDPAACGAGDTGVGDSGAGIGTGWMKLCVDTDTWPPVDGSTLTGKVVTGYQGWFGAPGDGSQRNRWVHWFRSQTPAPANATFDLWPDLSELSADELFATDMQYAGGQNASLFSSYNQRTVERHLEWMADYGIDAAFLQRFLSEVGGGAGLEFRDQVTRNVKLGAEKTGRAFIVMYDISGAPAATLVDDLIDDWKHLVDDPTLAVTSSDRYLQHQGRPLVAIWGFGFTDRPGSPDDALAVIDFFHDAAEPRHRATVMGGVPTHWRTGTGDSQPGFDSVYRSFDVISPWSVGRYGTEAEVESFNSNHIRPDLAEAATHGRDYLPVVWPGFSWANLRQDPGLFNAIPRLGGRFFHKQLFEAQDSGCEMLYVAMFDEVDESTAIFKAAASQADLPATGLFLALDQDGLDNPSDWYLRLAGAGTKMLTGQVPLSAVMPMQ